MSTVTGRADHDARTPVARLSAGRSRAWVGGGIGGIERRGTDQNGAGGLDCRYAVIGKAGIDVAVSGCHTNHKAFSNGLADRFPHCGDLLDVAVSRVGLSFHVNHDPAAAGIFADNPVDGVHEGKPLEGRAVACGVLERPQFGRESDARDVHGRLQNAYQCNQIALTAATQLQQAEIARDKDYQKLSDPSVTSAQQQPILDDIRAQNAQIGFLRAKIGLSAGDMSAINNDESTITKQGRIVADLTAANRAAALTLLQSSETDISSRENPAITNLALKAAKAQSLVAGIEAYLSGLTGGAVNFTPPSSSTPTPQAAGAPAAGAPAAGAPAVPGGPTPSPSSAASSTPPIVTILQVDGLAGRMGFRVTDPDSTDSNKPGLAFDQIDAWRVLWLKSMESGGAIITKTSIFGSHPYFGGGAVSGYALFTLEGSLLCSGNTAAYGGFVKAADFPNKGGNQPTRMLDLGGACTGQ
jgi:hypothetical protein